MARLLTCLAIGVTLVSSQDTCPPDWTLSGSSSSCVRLYSEKKTWSDARGVCRAVGADLVKIVDGNMNQLIWDLISTSSKEPHWIGLNDRVVEGTFVWLDEANAASYTNWDSGQPNNVASLEQMEGQDCSEIGHPHVTATKWNDNYCSTPFKFICEKPTVTNCVHSDADHEELEEKIEQCCVSSEEVHDNTKTIEELTERVSELSEQVKELAAVSQQTLQESSNQFSNLSQQISDLSSRMDDEVQSNAQKFEEIENELSSAAQDKGEEALIKLLSIDKSKYAVSGLYKTQIYIASKKNQKFDLQKTNEECKANGGYLLEFDDEEEQNFVENFMVQAGGSAYYTGGNDVDKEGTFVYFHSKKPVKNVQWKKGEPNDAGGKEDCMEVQRSGLNDQRCDRSVRFMCEIPLF